MIAANQVLEGIKKALADGLGAAGVYSELCPKEAARPAYWVETVKDETLPVNFCTVKKRMYFSVTCLSREGSGENGESVSPVQMQAGVTGLFQQGFLRLGGRALKVSADAEGHESDRAFVTLKFEFFDDRNNAEESAPLMSDVTVAIKKGD